MPNATHRVTQAGPKWTTRSLTAPRSPRSHRRTAATRNQQSWPPGCRSSSPARNRCAVNATKTPPTRWKPSALAAPYALSLRLEKLRHVLALAERRRIARGPAMLEICLVVGHAEHPAQGVTPGPAALCRPLPPFAVVSLPSHIPSPHTAPHVPPPSCHATRQATIPGPTSRSSP